MTTDQPHPYARETTDQPHPYARETTDQQRETTGSPYLDQLHHEIDLGRRLELLYESHDVRMIAVLHYRDLVLDHVLLAFQFRFVHDLHCVLVVRVLQFALLHEREVSVADHLPQFVLRENRVGVRNLPLEPRPVDDPRSRLLLPRDDLRRFLILLIRVPVADVHPFRRRFSRIRPVVIVQFASVGRLPRRDGFRRSAITQNALVVITTVHIVFLLVLTSRLLQTGVVTFDDDNDLSVFVVRRREYFRLLSHGEFSPDFLHVSVFTFASFRLHLPIRIDDGLEGNESLSAFLVVHRASLSLDLPLHASACAFALVLRRTHPLPFQSKNQVAVLLVGELLLFPRR